MMSVESGPHISAIVPVHNGGPQFALCLDALVASDYGGPFEIIVVDDLSDDASAAAARTRGVTVVRLGSRSGPAEARNRGAERARAPLLLFVDADVVVRPDALARVASFFRSRSDAAAVFGSYDDAPAATNFVSRYKNLLHHFVHQRSNADAATFWAGCGAIRRAAFDAVGGFDARRYARPSIEDIELGYRLRRRGFSVVLDKELQVKHLKRWTLPSLLRTDIFSRAVPWSRLIFESGGGVINDLNLRTADRASASLTGGALLLAALSIFAPALLAGALAALAAVFYINRRLYRFFYRLHGALFAAGAFGLHLLYFLYSGAAFALCFCAHALGRMKETARPGRKPAPGPERMNDA